jgi:hypothetical protein
VEIDRAYLGYISTDVQHRDAAKCCTPEQTLSASDFLDDVEGECTHAKSLRNTVEAGGEKLGRGSCDAHSLEDSRSIIGDDVLKAQISHLRDCQIKWDDLQLQ